MDIKTNRINADSGFAILTEQFTDLMTVYPFFDAFLYEKKRRKRLKKETAMETFEKQKKHVAEYNLTSDLFAGKIFEDLDAAWKPIRWNWIFWQRIFPEI